MTGRRIALAAAMAAIGLSGCASTGKMATAAGPPETVTGYVGIAYGRLALFPTAALDSEQTPDGDRPAMRTCRSLEADSDIQWQLRQVRGRKVTATVTPYSFPNPASGAYVEDGQVVYWNMRRTVQGQKIREPLCGDHTRFYWVDSYETVD